MVSELAHGFVDVLLMAHDYHSRALIRWFLILSISFEYHYFFRDFSFLTIRVTTFEIFPLLGNVHVFISKYTKLNYFTNYLKMITHQAEIFIPCKLCINLVWALNGKLLLKLL